MRTSKEILDEMGVMAYIRWRSNNWGSPESDAADVWLEAHHNHDLGEYLKTHGYKLVDGEYVK